MSSSIPSRRESLLPYYSLGNRDDAIQRRYIEALYHYWNNNNPTGGTYGGPMLDMGELAIWCWDAQALSGLSGPLRHLGRLRRTGSSATG